MAEDEKHWHQSLRNFDFLQVYSMVGLWDSADLNLWISLAFEEVLLGATYESMALVAEINDAISEGDKNPSSAEAGVFFVSFHK